MTAIPLDSASRLRPMPTAPEVGDADLGDLLDRVADGDRGALGVLYDRTAPRLFGLVRRLIRDEGYAEETLQEVYLQVWNHAGSFRRDAGSPMSWLLTIAHRRAVDRIRSEEAAGRRLRDYDPGAGTAAPAAETEALDGLGREHNARLVTRCLGELTPTQRESLRLAYFDGHTYREVAELLDAALPTVKSRIRDGLRRLRTCLGGDPR